MWSRSACALGRVPEHDELRSGHLDTDGLGCAAVIDDPEQREAPIRDAGRNRR
jgi:hypothetical protein